MAEVFEVQIKPAYYDFDPSGMAHNAVYVRWLEDARATFLESGPWPPDRFYAEGVAPALTRTEVVYKTPIRLSEPVAVRVRVTRLGRSAWSLAFAFVHPETGREYARAEQSGCFIRRATGKPIPMPPEFLAFCRAYLDGETAPE